MLSLYFRKKGNMFSQELFCEFSTHAQVPTGLIIDEKLRVYYAARNNEGKSFTTYVDLEPIYPYVVQYNHKRPVMDLGAPGSFDEDGIMPSIILPSGNDYVMYYSGWNQKVSTPYHNSTGVAISHDQGVTFKRIYEGPVLERNHLEPYVTVTPTILIENELYRMWYVSGLRWLDIEGHREPIYVIMYAESRDGIIWNRQSKQIIPSYHEFEAFSRPTVFNIDKKYHMLFCCRGSHDYRDGANGYKMGYAFSSDGYDWIRSDESLIVDGATGSWEDKMNCYPFYIKIENKNCILYNGNGFGRTGFGIAVLEGL